MPYLLLEADRVFHTIIFSVLGLSEARLGAMRVARTPAQGTGPPRASVHQMVLLRASLRIKDRRLLQGENARLALDMGKEYRLKPPSFSRSKPVPECVRHSSSCIIHDIDWPRKKSWDVLSDTNTEQRKSYPLSPLELAATLHVVHQSQDQGLAR